VAEAPLGVSDGCSEGRTLVIDNGRLTGIISPSDINRLLQRSLSGRNQALARGVLGGSLSPSDAGQPSQLSQELADTLDVDPLLRKQPRQNWEADE
jgi:hypothetical protein